MSCCPSSKPDKTETCSTEAKCCPKKWLMVALIAFAATMAYDWYVHGTLLMEQYKATAKLWRPEAEMQAMMNYCIAKHALQAMIFACLFLCWKSRQTFGALFSCACPGRKGFGFGATIGLLLGLQSASAYIYQAIPHGLAISWLGAEVVKWGLAGAILAVLYGRCNKA
jgi:hypothetical protein